MLYVAVQIHKLRLHTELIKEPQEIRKARFTNLLTHKFL